MMPQEHKHIFDEAIAKRDALYQKFRKGHHRRNNDNENGSSGSLIHYVQK